MKFPKWPWWGWALAIVVGLGVLSAIVSPPNASEESAPTVRLQSLALISGGRNDTQRTFSVVVPPSSPAGATENAARDICSGATHCQVFGFFDAAAKATAMPMTEREARALVFSYTLNRSSGMDESMWDCAAFADVPADRCISRE